jgi:microcystin-dependent protein
MGTPYMSEIRIMAFDFAPQGWAQCNGQLLPINSNQALFSLLGTTFGGNGQTTFGLPDLRGRIAIDEGNGHALGEVGGEQGHTLTVAELPTHIHTFNVDATTPASSNVTTPAANTVFGQSVGAPSTGSSFAVSMYDVPSAGTQAMAPATLATTGGSQPHENMQPYLVLNFCIALQGVFPSRN